MSKEKREIVAIDLCWFLLIAYLSSITAYQSDDYMYMHFCNTERLNSNLSDILLSTYWDYINLNGRAVVNFFDHVFAWLPRIAFSVCNAIVYIAFVNLVYRFVLHGIDIAKERKPYLLCGLYFVLYFTIPSWFENLWIAGSIGYLWTNTIIIGFAYLYFQRINSLTVCGTKPLYTIGMLLLGILAGLSNESGSCTLIAALFCLVLWNCRERRKLCAEQWAGIIGAVLGFFVLMFAPSNFLRIENTISSTPQKTVFLYQLVRTLYYGMRYNLAQIGITLFFVILSKSRDRQWWSRDELWILFFALLNILAMAFSPGYAVRTVLFSTALCTIAWGRAVVRYVNLKMPEGGDARARRTSWKALYVAKALLVLLEIATGTLLHYTKGTDYDRRTVYCSFDDDLI